MQNRIKKVWSIILVAAIMLSFFPGGIFSVNTQAAAETGYENGYTWNFDQAVTLGNTKGLVSGNAAGTIKVMNHEGNNSLTPNRAIADGVLTTTVAANWGNTVGHGVFYKLPAALEEGRIYQLSLNLYGGNYATAMNGITVSFGDYTDVLTGSGGNIQQWTSSGMEGMHNADAKLTRSISGNLSTEASHTVEIEFIATDAMAAGSWMLVTFPLALNSSYKLGDVTLEAADYEGGYTWNFDKTVDTFTTATEFKTLYYGNEANTVGIVNHEGYGSAWGENTSRSLKNGLLTSVMTAGWGEEGHGVYYRLPAELVVGKTYQVSMNLYAAEENTPLTNDKSSSITVSFNSETKMTQEWQIANMEGYHNADAKYSVPSPTSLSTQSDNVVSFEFVATQKIVDAGSWMLITFPMEDGKTYILGDTTINTVNYDYDDGYTWNFDKTVEAFGKTEEFKHLYYGNESELVSIISSENYASYGSRSLKNGVLTTVITEDADWARGANGVYYRLPTDLVVGQEYAVRMNLYASEEGTSLINNKASQIKLSFTNEPTGNNIWTAGQIESNHNAETLLTYSAPDSLSTDVTNELTLTFFATQEMADNDGWMLITFPLETGKAVNLGRVTLKTVNYEDGYTWKFDKTVEAFGETTEFKTVYYGNEAKTVGIVNHEGYGKNWGENTSRSLKNGLLTSVITASFGEGGHGIYYKLPKELVVGQAYEVSMNLRAAEENTPMTNDKSSSITVSFNREMNGTQEWLISNMEAYHNAANKFTVYAPTNLSTQSDNVIRFAFVATQQIVEADQWMLITFPMEDGKTYILGDASIKTVDYSYENGYTWEFDNTITFTADNAHKVMQYGNKANTVGIISHSAYANYGTRSLQDGILTTNITATWAKGANGLYYKLPIGLNAGQEYVVSMKLYATAEGTALVNSDSTSIKLSFINEIPTEVTDKVDQYWTAAQIEGIHNADTLLTYRAPDYLSTDTANKVEISFVATQAMADNDGWMLISMPLAVNQEVNLGATTLREKKNTDNHFLNGNFSDGLTGWMTNVDSSYVSVQDSVLNVTDKVPTGDVKLYQTMYLERGIYRLSFDVLGAPTSWRPVYFMGTALDNSSVTGSQLQVAQESGKVEGDWWTVTRDVIIETAGTYYFQMNLNQVSSDASVAPAMQYDNFKLCELDSVIITWKNDDGTVLEEDLLLAGSVPEYNGKIPTKEANGHSSYKCIGWDKDITVVNADTTYTAQYEEVITSDHDWGEGIVNKAATCGEDGERKYTCSVCGETKIESITATGAHTWGEGVVSKAPTCDADGEMTYTCTACDAFYTEAIDSLTDGVAQIGDTKYATLQTAVDAATENDVVVLLKDSDETVTVAKGKTLYLDLNGNDVAKVTVEEGGLFYGMDTTTDDYICGEDDYGKIGAIEGKYEPAYHTNVADYGKRYVAVAEGDEISFHRFYVGVTYVALRPGMGGAGYIMTIAGDSKVKSLLVETDAYGYTVSVTAGDKKLTESYSGNKADFEGGVQKLSALTVDHILTVNDTSLVENPIEVTAFIRFVGMDEIEVSTTGRSFKEIVLATEEKLATEELSAEQINALRYMYNELGVGELNWEIPNIAALAENAGSTSGTLPASVDLMSVELQSAAVVAAESKTELFEFMGANMALNNSLAMNFAFATDHYSDWSGFYAEIVKEYADGREDVTVTIPVKDWENRDSYYLVSYNGIAAKEMADNFYITIYNAEGEAVSVTRTDSVRAYAKRTLDSEKTTDGLKTVVVDMLNYGAASQNFFGYGVDDLATDVLTEAEQALASAPVAISDARVGDENFAGSQLILESNIRLVLVFGDVTEGMYAKASYIDARGKAKTVDCQIELLSGNYGKVNVNALAVADYNSLVNVTVYNADGSVYATASDSVAGYVSRNNESAEADEALKVLGQELVKFAASACDYFLDNGSVDDNNTTILSASVSTENGKVSEAATFGNEDVSAQVPAGVQVENNTLTLTVTEKDASDSGVALEDGQQILPLDIHMDGVSAENATPIQVCLGKILPNGLNIGNVTLYHVEDGVANAMTQAMTLAELDEHNEFYYDPATGDITVAMASFSEVAMVSEEPAWNGEFDYTWYDAGATELTIANADQLAGLSAIVGGMDGQTQDSFAGKTIKLIGDINIGDLSSENGIVFYPIGYYNSEGNYEKSGKAITSAFKTFEGTFDGNGHTISNFYQNTWEMKGDHEWYAPEEQCYRDGMGLFGKVYGGTVKNLTVKNFSSDGEITTTGTIAAYADCGATFENIAITNCNPKVYNIGNGGIVGCVGWYTMEETDKPVTFTNITVDNTNKISALWGSYDVACGGIVGQYYPTSGQTSAGTPKNAGITLTNCHVAAQMDVYNDVCANYQYYAYRYAGILIGSVRENETINGHVYPKMDGITASDCTVHFGDWNDYYYCELVANSLASYTHDHQFSRLEQVASVDVENMKVTSLKGVTTDIPTSGRVHYVVVKEQNEKGEWKHGDGHDYAECYHFVDGKVWNHEDAGTEIVNGETVLKEDKQLVYREFDQLITGYGWGVTSKGIGEMDGVTILDREEGSSVEKFAKADTAQNSYLAGTTVTIGELFAEVAELEAAIDTDNVQVFVSPVSQTSTVRGDYVADTADWTKGELTFYGIGAAKIVITDYYYCKETVLYISIVGDGMDEVIEIQIEGADPV